VIEITNSARSLAAAHGKMKLHSDVSDKNQYSTLWRTV